MRTILDNILRIYFAFCTDQCLSGFLYCVFFSSVSFIALKNITWQSIDKIQSYITSHTYLMLSSRSKETCLFPKRIQIKTKHTAQYYTTCFLSRSNDEQIWLFPKRNISQHWFLALCLCTCVSTYWSILSYPSLPFLPFLIIKENNSHLPYFSLISPILSTFFF